MENDEGIRTFDKVGKVTVIIEENQAFSDQVVMLNVMVAHIYTLSVTEAYSTLTFPMASTINLPIEFQNEKAHSFADKIEGISVGVELSHPRVVKAKLDQYNSTLILEAQGNGECNVVVYLIERPEVFDVIKVRVTSVVSPGSPIMLHVGGEVLFQVIDDEQQWQAEQATFKPTWSSSDPSVLEIDRTSGKANGLSEGHAQVLLSNHVNAASLVKVQRVVAAEIDSNTAMNLLVDTAKEQGVEKRVRIKLFMPERHELKPEEQFNGRPLISHNVGINCESDTPYLAARGEINYLEGFFCVLTHKQGDYTKMPATAKISVSISSKPKDGRTPQSSYHYPMMQFEVQLSQKIWLGNTRSVQLNSSKRTADVEVFSNVDFRVEVVDPSSGEALNPHESPLKYSVVKNEHSPRG